MNPRCKCGGRQNVYKSKTSGLRRTRYLKCVECRGTGKSIVSIDKDGYETEPPETGLPEAGNKLLGNAIGSLKIQPQQSNTKN